MTAGLEWLVPLLICPVCRQSLQRVVDENAPLQGVLRHGGQCSEVYPIIDGVPRLVTGMARRQVVQDHPAWFSSSQSRQALATSWTAGGTADEQIKVVRDFDFEWALHDRVRTPDASELFAMYFDLVPEGLFGEELVALDAGCGAGRWALEVAQLGPRVIAVDLGSSVDIARRNAGGNERVACLQADLRRLPLRDGAVDWAYSLGVLHHVTDPERALDQIMGAVRPRGTLLVYLYYALDGRGPLYRGIFRVANLIRVLTSRMPRWAVRGFATAVAISVYWPLARLSRFLATAGFDGLSRAIPLGFYRDLSLATMLNDSLDRFGTRLERRYTRREVIALLERAGTTDVIVSPQPPYWHATAIRRP